MSIYKGTQLISGVTTPIQGARNIGQIIQSTIPLTDAGLHLLDGTVIQGSGIYSAFVDYIASIYDASANYFCTEAEWQQSVTDYGVCGKFVYDSVNNTVRLPLIEGFTEGTIDTTVLGDLTEAGLPNITGSTYSYSPVVGSSGAFSHSGSVATHYSTDVGGVSNYLYLDASDSNGIYGNSNTVQPQSIKVLYYIVVATFAKTDIQVDIDEIATDLNGKADTDLSNISVSQSAKNEIVSWGLPDYASGIGISISGNSFSYTCPNDGIITAKLYGLGNDNVNLLVNGSAVLMCNSGQGNVSTTVCGSAPVSKNDVITIYGASSFIDDYNYMYFYPLKGVN